MLIEAAYKLSELPQKDAKKFAKESEDVFYQAWYEVLAEKVNDPREYSSDPDADLLNDLSKLVAFYDKVYAGSAKIDSYRTLNAEAANQKSKAATAKSQANGLLEGDYTDTVESQNFYITQRLENSYGGGVLDEIGRALESEDNTQWVAYNVETIMGQAYPGDRVYVLVTDSEHSFSETGAYRLSYMPMGKTMDLTDSKGFIKTASVYYIVDADQGDAFAQNELGKSCLYGNGVATDKAEAFQWFWKAANQGDEEAKNAVKRLESGSGSGVGSAAAAAAALADQLTLADHMV